MINGFAAIEAVDDMFWPVPKPFPMHVDHLLIVGLEHDAHFNIEYAIVPQDHPATATRQHYAP
jgi:hypothetical protein